MTFEDFLDELVVFASDDARVRALWIEALERKALRRPYGGGVRVHAVADEPDFNDLVDSWDEIVGRIAPVNSPRWGDTERTARQLDGRLAFDGGERETAFVLECSAFLAKRPRQAVVALVDKTGHLIHVMDFAT